MLKIQVVRFRWFKSWSQRLQQRMVEVVDDYKPGDLVEALCDEDQTWYTAVVQDSFGCQKA